MKKIFNYLIGFFKKLFGIRKAEEAVIKNKVRIFSTYCYQDDHSIDYLLRRMR